MSKAVFDLAYFDEVAFDEAVVVPTAIPQAASNIGGTTARINGKITDDGGESCEARFRWRKKDAIISNNQENSDYITYGVNWKCQTFTPVETFTLGEVKLGVKRLTNGEEPSLPVTVSLRATDEAGKPTGADLRVKTLNIPTGSWTETFTFDTGYEVLASTKYAIVMRAPTGYYDFFGDQDYAIFVAWSNDVIPNGELEQSADSGETWAVYAYDFYIFLYEAWTTTDWQNTLETNDEYYEDLTELDEGIEYEFQTQPKNSAGEGEWSASAYFETTALVITPSPAQAVGSVVAPTVILGSTTATPEHIDALAQVIQPNVQQGNIIFSPAVIDAICEGVNPTVIHGSLSLSPDFVAAIVQGIDPTVILGSTSISPEYVKAIAGVMQPIVSTTGGVVYVTPDPASAIGGIVAPTVILGSIVITPEEVYAIAQVVAPNVVQGNIIFSPEYVKALGRVVAPTVIGGDIILIPESIEAIARGENPEVILASMTVTPEFVKALAGVIAPTVLETWVGRKLRIRIVTSQYHSLNVITSQNRNIDVVTAQKRKIKTVTSGG